MDTGDILVQERFPLGERETGASLSAAAAQKSAVLLGSFLKSLGYGLPPGLPQNSEDATYTSLVKKEDGRIDWSLSALELDARIRAYTPWPLCVTCHGEAELYILEGFPAGEAGGAGGPPGTVAGVDKNRGILIQTGKGMLCVSRLQYGTKKALGWRDFLNGAKGFVGSVLGDPDCGLL
jgi:methionyl-tRNA formyltransferase